jgi:mono/diheme cytochrome c family protein
MRTVVIATVEFCLAISCLIWLGAATPVVSEAAPVVRMDDYQQNIVPLFTKYCIGCHGGKKPKGDLNLDDYKTSDVLLKKVDLMETMLANVKNGEMPPEGKPKPTRAELDALTGWLNGQIVKVHLNGKRDPGRVTMRRLNRNEYNNTIRDLLGVDFKPAEDFPLDDVGYGFDNNGDVLTLPPILLEKYLNAAERIVDQAMLPKPDPNTPTKRQFQGKEMLPRNVGTPYGKNNQARMLATNGEVHVDFDFIKAGKYVLRFRAFGQQAGTEAPKLDLKLDGKLLKTFDVLPVEKDSDGRKTFEFIATIPTGKHKIGMAYTNDFYDPNEKDEKKRDRNLIIIGLTIEGPTDAPRIEVKHPVLIVKPTEKITPRDAARQNLGILAGHAFRRPVQSAEIDKLMKLFDKATKRGDNFADAMKLPLQAILVSPHFLFRVELDGTAQAVRPLTDYELASRLSYFIWSSMPDEALFTVARQGKLKDPEVLAIQAKRMLLDPKATALTENFAGQWLQLRNLNNSTPDPKRFPTFDEPLRQAMKKETELFFQEMLQKDHKISEFLDADFTFVNDRLAKHYGIKDVKGPEFRRVSLKETPRRGILTQASILTLTSNPTRTSPVKRGKWVLETIMGTPPPPPPPDVPELKETGELKGSLRERMEQHRANPNCAVCHNRMDPIGFGFENFDAVGAWRTKDGAFPVEPGGTLPNGQSFQTPMELITLLKQREEDFRRCLSEKMVTFAMGRGLESVDRQYVNDIAKATQTQGDTLTALIQEVVKSEPFRQRRTATK